LRDDGEFKGKDLAGKTLDDNRNEDEEGIDEVWIEMSVSIRTIICECQAMTTTCAMTARKRRD